MKRKSKASSRTPRLPVGEMPPAAAFAPSVLQRGEMALPVRRCAEVNARCVEMLVHAARHERQTFALVAELRDLFALSTPATRRRVAERAFLLVDMNFRDPDWWNAVRRRPTDPQRNPPWRGSFPRLPAIQLVRATLLMAWNGLRADPATACVLFGMTPTVGSLLTQLTLNQIDGIAQKHFQQIRARWDDRPAVWRKLLLAAQTDEVRPMGELNLHALQLLAGELLVPAPAA